MEKKQNFIKALLTTRFEIQALVAVMLCVLSGLELYYDLVPIRDFSKPDSQLGDKLEIIKNILYLIAFLSFLKACHTFENFEKKRSKNSTIADEVARGIAKARTHGIGDLIRPLIQIGIFWCFWYIVFLAIISITPLFAVIMIISTLIAYNNISNK